MLDPLFIYYSVVSDMLILYNLNLPVSKQSFGTYRIFEH